MGKEIERKFLVKDQTYKLLAKGVYYHQGYLNSDTERVVRVRIAGTKAFLTIKSKNTDITRLEFEYPIPLPDAQELLEICLKPTIQKYRYTFEYNGHTWEVDEFEGENTGLIVAEIELQSEDQPFDKPKWIGHEVTHDPRYYNANLIKYPYNQWTTK